MPAGIGGFLAASNLTIQMLRTRSGSDQFRLVGSSRHSMGCELGGELGLFTLKSPQFSCPECACSGHWVSNLQTPSFGDNWLCYRSVSCDCKIFFRTVLKGARSLHSRSISIR